MYRMKLAQKPIFWTHPSQPTPLFLGRKAGFKCHLSSRNRARGFAWRRKWRASCGESRFPQAGILPSARL